MAENNIEGNTGGTAPARSEPNHLRRAIIIWAVLSVIGMVIIIVTTPFVLPPSASELGSADNFTMAMLTVLSVPVALFVFVFLGYSVFAFRVNGRPTEDALPEKPRPGLQIGWFGITGALCLFLVIYGLFAFYQETSAASTNPLVVKVTGQQWMWTFSYPQYGATSAGAQVIEIPVNRPVVFEVTSQDVLHGFAVRALGIRVDANPGEVTTTPQVTPTQIGSYTVVCVELCGLYHSYMWEAVQVVSSSSFNSWIISQGGHP
jgi:cytochrome c oxidase subunit II